jgi:hypothetical protein
MQPRPLIHISYPIFFVLDWRFNHVVTLSRARKAGSLHGTRSASAERPAASTKGAASKLGFLACQARHSNNR